MAINRFALNPTSIDIGRTRFPRPTNYKTTFKTGDLIPIYVEDVLPGDTVEIDVNSLLRQLTPSTPVMDMAYLDIHFYFVPMRQVWEHTKQFFGENDTTAWTQKNEYMIPVCRATNAADGDTSEDYKGTLADYFGLPFLGNYDPTRREIVSKGKNYYVNALYLRSYKKIWNDWWRDQNYQGAELFSIEDTDPDNDETGYYRYPLKANKFHDYFTSVLPMAQKAEPVTLNLATTADITSEGTAQETFAYLSTTNQPNGWGGTPIFTTGSTQSSWLPLGLNGSPGNPTKNLLFDNSGKEAPSAVGNPSGSNLGIDLRNLKADLTNATALTVNALRWAVQIQKIYEADARYGTRYQEYLQGHFAVTGPNLELQVTEYLGGTRVPVNMDTVVANSSGTGDEDSNILGQLSGYSKTGSKDHGLVKKSFTEHGIIMGLAVVRTQHTYSQGLDRKFLQRRRFDLYDPKLANIGEMPVFTSEINLSEDDVDGTTGNLGETTFTWDDLESVFGYQEAWAWYRYTPNRISGELRPDIGGLPTWTYADDHYSGLASASSSFMEETEINVERTLKLKNKPQWLADFAIYANWRRAMPLYSIPGQMDHH